MIHWNENIDNSNRFFTILLIAFVVCHSHSNIAVDFNNIFFQSILTKDCTGVHYCSHCNIQEAKHAIRRNGKTHKTKSNKSGGVINKYTTIL